MGSSGSYFETFADHSSRGKTFDYPIAILLANRAKDRDPYPEFCQPARRNRCSSTYFAVKFSRKRFLAELRQGLKTAEHFINEELTNNDYLGLDYASLRHPAKKQPRVGKMIAQSEVL